MNVWDYELERNHAGAFGMQYIISHPTTYSQSKHIMWATSLIQQIMGYIAGADGLSEAEIDLLCENQQYLSRDLCTQTFSSNAAKDNLEIGASFSEIELTEAVIGYLNECDVVLESSKEHFVSALYMALCVAGSDGLEQAHMDKFFDVADVMGFTIQDSKKILRTYQLECELISSFNDIYDLNTNPISHSMKGFNRGVSTLKS